MIGFLKEGFHATRKQPFLLLFLFLYQLVWGMILYRFIGSVIVPLLYRYPGEELSPAAAQLFFAEGQFQLMKTDISHPVLWTLGAMAAIRMVLTPVLNAGTYYSLHHTELNSGYRFFKGIRELTKPYLLCYAIQMALTAAPLIWLIPHLGEIFARSPSIEEAGREAIPYIGAYLLYGFLVRLAVMYIQLGKLSRTHWIIALGVWFRHILTASGVALAVLLLSGAASLLVMTASLYWAGFAAVVVYQVYHLASTTFQVWAIAAQHRLWIDKI